MPHEWARLIPRGVLLGISHTVCCECSTLFTFCAKRCNSFIHLCYGRSLALPSMRSVFVSDLSFRIRELMSEPEFKGYLGSSVGNLALFDSDWQPVIQMPEAVMVCAAVSKQTPVCVQCPVRAELASQDLVQDQCDAHVLTTVGRV